MKSIKKEYKKSNENIRLNIEIILTNTRGRTITKIKHHRPRKKLKPSENAEYMRQKLKEKREQVRRDNPNYEEEKKIRQRELHRISNLNYSRRKAEANKQLITVDTI
jgi:hypothetical protein